MSDQPQDPVPTEPTPSTVEEPPVEPNVQTVEEPTVVEPTVEENLTEPNVPTVEEPTVVEPTVEENLTQPNDSTVDETPVDETPVETPVEPNESVVEATVEDDYVPSEELRAFANTIYEEYKDMVVSLNITADNFIIVVTKCLERVEKVRNMSGQEKYAVSVMVLDKLVDEIPNADDNDKYYLRNLVPSLIEIVLDASKGKLNLNLKKVKRRHQVNVKQVIDDLYEQIKDIIKENDYSADYIARNITVIVGMLMTAVEKYPDLTGAEKKAIVIRVIDTFIDDLVNLFPDMDRNLVVLIQHAKLMLPTVIDMLISVGRKHFAINVKKCMVGISSVFKGCKCCRK